MRTLGRRLAPASASGSTLTTVSLFDDGIGSTVRLGTVGRPTGSLCRRLAGRRAGEMGVEECARLFLCVFCCRLVIFEPMTESVAPGLQPSNVKGVMGAPIHGQRDRRAVRACFRNHLATSIGRG